MNLFERSPVARDITIENITDMTIYAEFSFSSAFSGVELEIEKNNPNMEYLLCRRCVERVDNEKIALPRIQCTAMRNVPMNCILASTRQAKRS